MELEIIVKENTWLQRGISDHGWGNGYVAIPLNHPLFGVHYDEIHEIMPDLQINGGLTFSRYSVDLNWEELNEKHFGCWIIGFDTAHYNNTLESWPKEKVIQEAESLKRQIEEQFILIS